jgi:hypothetical protein
MIIFFYTFSLVEKEKKKNIKEINKRYENENRSPCTIFFGRYFADVVAVGRGTGTRKLNGFFPRFNILQQFYDVIFYNDDDKVGN